MDIPNSIAFFTKWLTLFIMPEKVNGNKFSGKSNIASLNSNHSPIDSKSAVQLNSTEQKLATIQKIADNSPYSQRFAQLKSLANKTMPSKQPVSQLSKDSHSLPDNVKQGVESLSGISMDDVKVHYNSAKPAQLNAHAYAQGTDIHIASGQEKHLPHEAWHVVQQKQGRVRPTTMMKAKVPINDDQGLENEADVMGARALQIKPFSLSDYKTEKSFQRKEIIQRNPLETIPEGDEKKSWEYPEGEKPRISVKELIAGFNGDAPANKLDSEDLEPEFNEADVYPENDIVKDTENPMKAESSEEFSHYQRLKAVSSKIIALSASIEKIKEKKAEKVKIEEDLKRAKKAEANAVEAVKILSKMAKKAALIKEAQHKGEEVLKNKAAKAKGNVAAEAERLENERIAAEEATLLAIKNAEKEAENARWKFHENFGENTLNGITLEMFGVLGNSIDVYSRDGGDESMEMYTGDGAFVGGMASMGELFTTTAKFLHSEKKPADIGILALTVGKFVTQVIDGVNVAMSGEIVGEALTSSFALLPGIKAGLGAFKNAVEAYQTRLKLLAIIELKEKTGHLQPKDKEILEKYSADINFKLNEIGVDFIFNAAESIAMIYPPAHVGIALIHETINLFKFARKQYLGHKDNKERKRTERIGDADVEKLKTDKIEEKSGRAGFREAIIILSKLKELDNKNPKGPEDRQNISNMKEGLRASLEELNKNKAGVEIITEGNLENFLEFEQKAINNISEEAKKEEDWKKRYFIRFRLPQKKDEIIKEMKKNRLFQYDNIKVDDIHKLDPAHQNYFFEKTKDAIKTASNRKHISSGERLDMMEKMLLTKHDDNVIKSYMLNKYENQKVYEDNDTEKVKYIKSVKKFKLEMKL